MEDLYLKDDPFNVKSKMNVEASHETKMPADVEAPFKASGDSVSSARAKGKNVETLESVIPESGENLGLDALNTAIDNMEKDKIDVDNADKETVHETSDTPVVHKDVGLDVETSLGQQVDKDAGITENDSGFHTVNDKENMSTHSVSHSVGNADDQAAPEATVELVSEEEATSVPQEQVVVDVDALNMSDEPLAKSFGISKRLRSNKGKDVATSSETPKSRKKATSIGPKKGWSKVTPKAPASKSKKRKAVSSNDSDYDVEEDVPNIVETMLSSKKSAVKKGSISVKAVATDKISFHYPDYAHKWKYVFNRRLALERELGTDALKIEDVIELIKEAGLMKTVHKLGNCYEKLVKEFLVNIPEDCDDPMSDEFQTVYVRGEKIKFSPKVINDYMGIVKEECEELRASDNQICKVLTANQIKTWPKKGKISSGKLSVKYAILNRIAACNWVPTTHSSDIATTLGRLIYVVGTRKKFDFGTYIFEQTVKHGKTLAVKLPIAFPTLLCDIILDQAPGIKYDSDVPKKRESPLYFHYKLFGDHHVPDIVGTSGAAADTIGSMTRKEIVTTLKETCAMLDERKALFERMIAALEREEGNENVRTANVEMDEEDVNADAKDKGEEEADDATDAEPEDDESEESSSED
jgi:hypothetical protein